VPQLQQAFMDNWLKTGPSCLHGDPYFPKQECARRADLPDLQKAQLVKAPIAGVLMLLVSIAAARHHIKDSECLFIPDNLTMRTLLKRCVEA